MNTPDAPRVLVVEDEALLASSIASGLESMGYQVEGPALDAQSALRFADRKLDAVVLDIALGGDMDGIEVAVRLRQTFQGALVYLTGLRDDALVRRAGRTRPHGFLLKPFDPDALRATLQVALSRAESERSLHTRVRSLEGLLKNMRDLAERGLDAQARPDPTRLPGTTTELPSHLLSRRERQICDEAIMGFNVNEIADTLDISPNTVRNHLQSVYRKLNINSQLALIRKYGPHSALAR